MGNPFTKIIERPALQARVLRLRLFLVGLARDYWKDAPFNVSPTFQRFLSLSKKWRSAPKPSAASSEIQEKSASSVHAQEGGASAKEEKNVWSADRIQVMEAMWGTGSSFPGGEAYIDSLTSPLGLNEESSVLDMGAGLGDMARKLVEEYKCYVTGLELDKTLATRGMVMSIAAAKGKKAPITFYDPVEYSAARKYDCIIAREVFCHVIGKEKFFKAVDSSLKNGGGQIVFTDLVMAPSVREKPAIRKWLEREKSMVPLTQIELIKTWKGMGYDLRIAEDQTALYKNHILAGLVSLVSHMKTNMPNPDTKIIVVREVDFWSRRLAAFGEGLKYYRFYGIKH